MNGKPREPKYPWLFVWLIALAPVLWIGFLAAVIVVLLVALALRVIDSDDMSFALEAVTVGGLVVVVVSSALFIELDRRRLATSGVTITPLAAVLVLFLWPVATPCYLFERSRRTGTSYAPAWVWLTTIAMFAALATVETLDSRAREARDLLPSVSNVYLVGATADAYVEAVRDADHVFEREVEAPTLVIHAESVCRNFDGGTTFEESVANAQRSFAFPAIDAGIYNRLAIDVACPRHTPLVPEPGAPH